MSVVRFLGAAVAALTFLSFEATAAQELMFSRCCTNGSALSVIDGGSATLTANLPVGASISLVAFGSDPQTAFLSDGGVKAVLTFDTASGTVIRQFPVPDVAAAMVASKDGKSLYLSIGNSVYAFDSMTGSTLGSVLLPSTAAGLALTPDGSTLYAVASVPPPTPDVAVQPATPISSIVESINTGTFQVTAFGHAPYSASAIALSPDGRSLFVTYPTGFLSLDARTLKRKLAVTKIEASPISVALSPDGRYAFIGEEGSSVDVFSARTGQALQHVPVAGGVASLAVSADGSTLFAATGAADTVDLIQTSTWTRTASIPVANAPSNVAVAPGSKTAYITNPGPSQVLLSDFSTITGTNAGLRAPQFFAMGPGNSTVYVTNYQSNTVVVLDRTGRQTASIPVDKGPADIVASSDGSRVYVINQYGISNFVPTVSVIDTSSNTVINSWEVTGGVLGTPGIGLSPDGATVYVASAWFFTYDAATGTLKNELTVPNENVFYIAAAPDGKTVYSSTSSQVVAIDPTGQHIKASIPIGSGCSSRITMRPDGKELWVADDVDMQVGVIDTSTNKLKATIPMSSAPVSIAFTPDSAHAFVTTGSSPCIVLGGPPAGASVVEFNTATRSIAGTIPAGGPTAGAIVLP